MDGMIDGGWSFVWSAYGLTWLGLGAYSVWLVLQLKGISCTEESEGAE